MLKKFILLMIAAAAVQMQINSVNAQINAEYDCETQYVEIKGSIENYTGDAEFMVTNLVSADEGFGTLNQSELIPHIVHLEQTSAAKGSYSIKYKTEYGAYSVYSGNGNITERVEFSAYPKTFTDDFKKINSSEELELFLAEAKSYLRCETKDYYQLTESSRIKVLSGIIGHEEDISSFEDIVGKINFCTMINKLGNTSISDTDIVKIFSDKISEYGIDKFEKYSIYLKQSDAFKQKVCRRIGKSSAYDIDGLKYAFNEAVLLEQVRTAINYQVIKPLVADAEKLFGISAVKYKKIGTNTEKADRLIKGCDYATVSDFIDDVERVSASVGTNSELFRDVIIICLHRTTM